MVICAFYQQFVPLAMGITFAICLTLTIYALLTPTDFTMMGGALAMALLGIIVVGFLTWFLPPKLKNTLTLALSGVSVFIFGLYLVYDI
jgi:FtsH-binding integral membrane protein